MQKQVNVSTAPAAIGPYSQGIEVRHNVFVSGQLPVIAETNQMAEGIEQQTRQSIENVKAVLAGCGLDLSHVVKTTVFLKHMEDFNEMNQIYLQYFSQPYPARSAVQVAALPKDALVEIECIAAKE